MVKPEYFVGVGTHDCIVRYVFKDAAEMRDEGFYPRGIIDTMMGDYPDASGYKGCQWYWLQEYPEVGTKVQHKVRKEATQ